MAEEQFPQTNRSESALPKMSCETFFSHLVNQEVGRVVEINRLPSKAEIIQAASNPFEIIIIQTEDESIYVARGEESDTGFEHIRQQLEGKKIRLIGHTHPYRDLEIKEKSLFFSSLPSAGDLTSKGSGAKQQFIFNTFGRTTFSTMDNLGPQSEGAVETSSMSQFFLVNAMRAAAVEARKQKITNIVEIINFIGNYLNEMFGTGFTFQNWDDVEDPFSK